jgi:hypothetical protein
MTMRISPTEMLFESRFMTAPIRAWSWWSILLLAVILPGAGRAQMPDESEAAVGEAPTRVQVLEDRISRSGLNLYRIEDLEKGQILYVHASPTSGYLDPLAALLKPGIDLNELTREPLDKLVATLSREHDPIEVSRRFF